MIHLPGEVLKAAVWEVSFSPPAGRRSAVAMAAAELKRRLAGVPPECRAEPCAVPVVEPERDFPDRQGGFREEAFGLFHAQIEEILSRRGQAGLLPAAREGAA